MSISPDATRILASYSVNPASHGCVPWKALNIVSAVSLEDVQPEMPVDGEKQYGSPIFTAHRSDLHNVLREAALSVNGIGPQVQLHLSSPVSSYDTHVGTITLVDGAVHSADLIIVANGVHSDAASYINGFDCPVQGVDTIVMRFLIPSEKILADPLTAPLLRRDSGHFISYISQEGKPYLMQYDCRDSTLQNFGMYVPKPIVEGENDHTKAMQSTRLALKEAMMEFHPSLRRLCDMTEDILPAWRITERQPVAKCVKGRLVAIGDAAHPMRPVQGQGYSSGVQDAAVLQVLFEDVKSGGYQLIKGRLGLFQRIRQARNAAVQLYSSKPITQNPAKLMKEEVRKWFPEERLPMHQGELNDWIMGFNAVDDARKTLANSHG